MSAQQTNSSRRGEVRDRVATSSFDGLVPVVVIALLILVGAVMTVWALVHVPWWSGGRVLFQGFIGGTIFAIGCLLSGGAFVNEQNQATVLTLFGKYVGTDSNPGLRYANPLYHAHKVSTRTEVVETKAMKVNDANGNPIEIAAAVTWHVDAPAKAILQVEDYEDFVSIQAEAAVRAFASEHPYDEHDDPDDEVAVEEGVEPKPVRPTLLGGGAKLADELAKELSERLAVAGVTVEQARIMHLAYAPEIASAMLRRQQAQAVIAAKRKIVKGAVGMVDDALKQLKEKGIEIDSDRNAALVSNLLVVLVSDREATPVVNAGSIHD